MWRSALVLGLLALPAAAGVPVPQGGRGQDSKPAAARPKPDRRLPAMFSPRAQVAAVGKANGATAHSEAAVAAGLEWLSRHQEPDGSWSCEKFRSRCEAEGYKCAGRGVLLYDVGISSLALLAFLASGSSEQDGRYRDAVRNGIRWLKSQQDAKGIYGTTEDYRYTFVHAIATLAMVENAVLSGSTAARDSAQRGLDYIAKIRSPDQKAWRYAEKPPDSDSTVTAWMVLALKAGQAGGIRSHDAGVRGASEFIRRITDEKTFRTGYLTKGDGPFRLEAQARRFPAEQSESCTACGMAVRIFGGEEPRGSGLLRGQARLLLDKPPDWSPDDGRIDMFYWHFASIAMFQLGGEEWKTWNAKLHDAALGSQQKGNPNESCQRGSWDPIDPWGTQGGRVYATAMMVLCLEAPYRFGRLFDQ